MPVPSLPTTVLVTALLFDMDGTLVDSTAAVERTWRSFADRHGLDARRILAASPGRRTEDTVAAFAPSGVDVDTEVRRLSAHEVVDTEGIVAVPGALELLATLQEGSWAVVTSAGRDLAEARMGAAGLPVPSVMICADDVTTGKPSPEGYLAAADRLGTAPERAVVLEDAEAGVLAARASGAHTLVVGPYAALCTEGLDRVADLRGVRVAYADDRILVSYLQASGTPRRGV